MSIIKIKFSIIMPCYNSALYVEDAINSVVSQNYKNWELLIINDGSTDDTLSIVERYASQDSRIKVFSKENGGYATAVNYGLDRITGDYFMFMGSDDKITSNLFCDVLNSISQFQPDLIAFRTIRYVDGHSSGMDRFTSFEKPTLMKNASIKEYEFKFPKESAIFFVRDTSRFYKTRVLGDLRYFGTFGYDADGIFSMLFAHKCRSFCNLPIDGYLWTLRSDSVSAKTSLIMDIDRMRNWTYFYSVIIGYDTELITEKEKNMLIIFTVLFQML